MAAFMMVSAIGFAVYMRESRMPSSHLRRQVSSRYLLKAALANAIDRIDGQFASYKSIGNSDLGDESLSGLAEGIYDDPYPGVGPAQNTSGNNNEFGHKDYGNRNGDLWIDRVFSPFGQVSPEQTVPTLTLEALAYLPPAVINDVRINSRKTRTAMWRNLSYELGRYAFTAVNVSDCFDLNRLAAGGRRTSAAGERISMSSLFRQKSGGLADLDTSLATSFDAILDKSGDIPFVSLADFNVVAGKTDFSPFCKFVGSSGMKLYDQGDVAALSNALFVTDTWFPPTNRTDTSVTVYNLAGQQPFTSVTSGKTASDVMEMGGSGFYDDLNHVIGTLGMLCLYDYLDKDSRPISFCIPTVETAPMVVGLALNHGGQIKPTVKAEPISGPYKDPETDSDGNITKTYTRTATKYVLKSLADGPVVISGSVMFPFRRVKEKGYKTSFSGDLLVRLWWAPENIRGRLADETPIYSSPDWAAGNGVKVKNGMVTVRDDLTSFDLSVEDNPTPEKAMGDFKATVDLSSIPEMPLYWSIQDTVTDMKGGGKPQVTTYCVMDGIKGDTALRPYVADGSAPCEWWTTMNDAAAADGPHKDGDKIAPEDLSVGAGRKENTDTLSGDKFVLHVAAWVRVKCGGEVVDIVPAKFSDDKEFGVGEMPEDLANVFENTLGGDTPILEFRGEKELTFSPAVEDALKGEAETFRNRCTLFCNDPRYNWAPECWFATASADGAMGGKAEEWRTEVGGKLLGQDSGGYVRDRDIFMFTSDQEYLQSIGELAFLPYLGWGGDGSFQTFREEAGDFDGTSVLDRNGPGQGPAANLYWKSYSAIDDDLYGIFGFSGKGASRKFQVISGTGDFRINPFSDDTRVLMTALANTPYDYYVASTNENANKFANESLGSSLSHAFNEKTDSAYISDDEMNAIARSMHGLFRSRAISGSCNWESAYDDLSWFSSDPNSFLGVTLEDPLYGVDRKFLYSFWRECFQNRQQLFLLFLRAEPLTVGGSSGDAVANSQLGARGVALVWRDPQPPANSSRKGRDSLANVSSWRTGNADGPRPHRTRILFYHQFD